MATKIDKRVREIKFRLAEYKKHENDAYAYYEEEVRAVRELRSNADKDIEFLLGLLETKNKSSRSS